MSPNEERKFKGLRNFNTVMSAVHLVQGLLILALSTSFSLPVMASFLHYNPLTQQLG